MANPVFISAASGWEIAIKRQLGKLSAPDNLDAAVEAEGFAHLPITFFHGEQAGLLPGHHRDPFDRMLVAQAQAQAEGLVIVTADPKIGLYGIREESGSDPVFPDPVFHVSLDFLTCGLWIARVVRPAIS